jgi:RNA polymerase sigma-70 factor, ECF subfamily
MDLPLDMTDGLRNVAGGTALFDEALVTAAQAGDQHALAELLDRSYPAVRGYLTWRSGDRELAADVTQDVLLRAADRIGQLARSDAFASWLYQIARNCLADATRQQRHILSLDWLLQQPASERLLTDPVSGITQWTDDELITQALGRLSDEAQEVIYLHDVVGFAVKDVALIIEIKPMAVYQRLHRARQAFRQHFEALNREPIAYGATRVADGTI